MSSLGGPTLKKKKKRKESRVPKAVCEMVETLSKGVSYSHRAEGLYLVTFQN